VVFDQDPKAGGMIRTQIPRLRLPESIIDEECGYILDLGIEFIGGKRIDSLKALLARAGKRSSSAPARRAAAISRSPAHGKRGQYPYRASIGSPPSPSATSARSASVSSCSGGQHCMTAAARLVALAATK